MNLVQATPGRSSDDSDPARWRIGLSVWRLLFGACLLWVSVQSTAAGGQLSAADSAAAGGAAGDKAAADARYAENWGPATGSVLPLLAAPDQAGKPRDLANLAGERGLLLFLVRSADWCPFCKRQLLQLRDQAPAFTRLGVAVAAMSYDSQDSLAGFHSTNKLQYPLLQDVDQRHVTAYGILNERYEPGHRAYGIPHPGVLLIAPDGKILAKFAVPGFRQRPPFDALLATLKSFMSDTGTE